MVDGSELQKRTCRACGAQYQYPVLKSTATRFYCADCMGLSPQVRATFEKLNKRVRSLTAAVEQMEKQAPPHPPSRGAP